MVHLAHAHLLALWLGVASVLAKVAHPHASGGGGGSVDAPYTFDAPFPSALSPAVFIDSLAAHVKDGVIVWTDCRSDIHEVPLDMFKFYADTDRQTCLPKISIAYAQAHGGRNACYCRTIQGYEDHADLKKSAPQEMLSYKECDKVYVCRSPIPGKPGYYGVIFRCPDRRGPLPGDVKVTGQPGESWCAAKYPGYSAGHEDNGQGSDNAPGGPGRGGKRPPKDPKRPPRR